MVIEIDKDGSVRYTFIRKSYRKARWRRLGQRLLRDFLKTPGAAGLIIVA